MRFFGGLTVSLIVAPLSLSVQASPMIPDFSSRHDVFSGHDHDAATQESASTAREVPGAPNVTPILDSGLGTRESLANNDGAVLVPIVVFGRNSRRTAEDFAKEHHIDPQVLAKTQSASGLIQCGDAHGAGQLTLSTDVVTTAAHVFFDENGKPRAASCTFDLTVDGKAVHVPVDLESIVAGSTNPYAVAPVYDWAVARLTRRVAGVRPYTIASGVHGGEPTTFVARGHIDWGGGQKLSIEECRLHEQIEAGKQGTREFSFDCDTGDGASGGALMFDQARTQIGGILVGWLSNHPFDAIPFCHTHYNFAVTMEGEFRRAVIAAAGSMMSEK